MKRIATYVKDLDSYYRGGHVTGGGPVVVTNIIDELAKRDDIELYIFTSCDSVVNIKNAQIIKIEVDELSKKCDEYKIDLMISGIPVKIPQIATLHAQSPLYKIKQINVFLRPLKKLLSWKSLKEEKNNIEKHDENTKFCVVSKRMLDDYSTNYNIAKAKIFYNYPGCTQAYEVLPPIKKNSVPTFGIVANSSFNKGGQFSLIVFTVLKMLNFKFHLKMILPKYKKDLIAKCFKLFLTDNVEFLPKQENMKEFYNAIDYLILPSLNEAFGLVVLEAMSYGKPCLVSKTTGAAEISPITFNRSIIDYVKSVKGITSQDYDKIACEAFELSKKFSWEKHVDTLLNQF